MSKLLHIKGSRTKILKTLPSSSFGNDGDIIISNIQGKGAYLCSKSNGTWYSSIKLQELNKIDKTSMKSLSLNKLIIKNTKLTPNKYSVPVGNLTLDVGNGNLILDTSGDIELNADGGQITIKDNTANHFLLDCDNTSFTIYDDQDEGDLFKIQIAQHGATTITTIDDDSNAAHLSLNIDGGVAFDIDGDVTFKHNGDDYNFFTIDHNNDYIEVTNNTAELRLWAYNDICYVSAQSASDKLELRSVDEFRLNQTYGQFRFGTGGTSSFTEQILFDVTNGNYKFMQVSDTGDYFNINLAANGVTTISTVDDDGAAAHLKFEPDGSFLIKELASAGADLAGYGQLWIKNSTPNELYFVTDAGDEIQLTSGTSAAGGGASALNDLSDVTYSSGDLTISSLDKIISGSLDFDSSGHINFDGCAAGFTRTTYADAADVEVDFTTGNKAHLDMTGGSITGTLTLKFPAISGNFVLVVQQDGSTRTINAYATKDAAGNAGNNDGGTAGAIRWAGGSAPDLTDGGNKRDVLSFYWDATEEVCYGVASLNF